MSIGEVRAKTTAVLIPCLNEAGTIGKVVRDFLETDPNVTVYVFDDNSSDDTARLAEEAGAVVVREYRRGKGRVVRSMFRDVEADVYVMVDGDDTYPADEALALREYVLDHSADMVIGDRLSEHVLPREHTAVPRLSATGSCASWSTGCSTAGLHDIMSGCRCMSREFVKTMPVLSAGFEIETEMSIHALDKGFLVREVPISYRDRSAGSVVETQHLLGRRPRDTHRVQPVPPVPAGWSSSVCVGALLGTLARDRLHPGAGVRGDRRRQRDRRPWSSRRDSGSARCSRSYAVSFSTRSCATARQAYEFQLTMFREQDAARAEDRRRAG